MTIDKTMLYLRSNFKLLRKSLVLITGKSQATSPGYSLRLCDLHRSTSVFVVLLEFTDFELLNWLCSKTIVWINSYSLVRSSRGSVG